MRGTLEPFDRPLPPAPRQGARGRTQPEPTRRDAALDFLPEGARLLDDRIRWSSRGLMSQIKALPVDFGS